VIILVRTLLGIIALPAILSATYLFLLTLLSASLPTLRSRSRSIRFDVIVPAHNEATVIARTVESLSHIEWPRENFRILVCADNCTDSTAQIARDAGAEVIERADASRRGKGYALEFAFQQSRSHGFAQAVVVVDADAEVSQNFLEAIAARLERGVHAVQVHYGVLNPMASWRTRLITIAKGSFHIVRSRARESLNLSCGIRGTGWCVTQQLLDLVPYHAFSLTEDVEYGTELGLAGHRVAYADEAHCNAEMVTTDAVAAPQRARWERGRFQLIRTRTLPLLRVAAVRRSSLCLDLALDLLVLPLSYIALNIAALLAIAALLGFWWPQLSHLWLIVGAACSAAITLYVLRGWQLSGIGLRGIGDIARTPEFLLWKIRLLFGKRQANQWQRTERENT
jgi:cellulose synthase/poly-beta-1,6-N-acetylglucosamine synthase-like glycosyltransferase